MQERERGFEMFRTISALLSHCFLMYVVDTTLARTKRKKTVVYGEDIDKQLKKIKNSAVCQNMGLVNYLEREAMANTTTFLLQFKCIQLHEYSVKVLGCLTYKQVYKMTFN